MRNFALRAAFVALALAVVPTAANADWLSAYSGNTVFNTPTSAPNGDGLVNFAVYHNDDNFASFGVNGATIASLLTDGTNYGNPADSDNAGYVYFYQIVNTDPNAGESFLDTLDVPILGPNSVRTAGSINGYVFTEGAANTNVGPTANQYLGSELGNGPPGPGSPMNPGTTPTGVAEETGNLPLFQFDSNDPTWSSGGLPDGTGYLSFSFFQTSTGRFTSLVFITSDLAPVVREARLRDGVSNFGPVPVPSPEPATMGLIALGVSMFGGLGVVRRLRRKATDFTPEAAA